MSHIENINWSFITKSIAQERTVLFLGPGVTVNYGQVDREATFFGNFAAQYPKDVLAYHPQDRFLVFRDKSAKLLHLDKIVRFYEQDFCNPLLEQIAEIPFHLIITITPDLSLNHIFDDRQFDYTHQYYKTKLHRQIDEKPTGQKPLLYNLLGCVKADESLITSHYDLFNHIQSVYGDRNLPQRITSIFQEDVTQNIIFLGFDFEKWYFQLILHLLKISYDPCIRYAAAQKQLKHHLQTLCESHFKINFISNDPALFIKTLHKNFEQEELRKPVAVKGAKRNYHKQNIVKFLGKAFNPVDFETFCMIHFEDVYQEFTPGQGQSARLNLLLQYVDRHEAYEQLLSQGKEENPVQYKNFAPYYEEQR